MDLLNHEIISCQRCPRLLKHCGKIAREKRKSFQDWEYWGRPVPSFGSLDAEVLIVGLAPAAHGANRTGRMFTGDRSGDWLYRALHRAGFANQAESLDANDGLELNKVRITAAAHCAPPDNKPSPGELENCADFLQRELQEMKNIKVFLVLGQIALNALWPQVKSEKEKKPKFSHGSHFTLASGRHLVCSYHPSQQNTFTGRLTEKMFDQVFRKIKALLT